MGKKKDKQARKAATKIAGVTLPKELRKSGEMIAELVKSPVARQLASAALVAAASAIATRKDDGGSKGGSGRAAPRPADPKQVGSELAGLVAQGIATFVAGLGQASRERPAEGERVAAAERDHATAGDGAKSPPAKPKLVR
jgi:hypothetical protein